MITITRAVQTSIACPAQWDSWDADGNYYYLRYRSGTGSVRQYETSEWYMDFDRDQLIRDVASFRHGDPLDGSISLEDFARLAGLKLADGLEAGDYGGRLRDGLLLYGIAEAAVRQEEKAP